MIPTLNIERIFLAIYDVVFRGEYSFEYGALSEVWGTYTLIAMAASAIFAAWLVYSAIREKQIVAANREAFYEKARTTAKEGETPARSRKWEEVLENSASDNPADWRLAILEADIMLDDVLIARGYSGETMGDRLKQAGFRTINEAWEAHRIRNQIAHEGSDYVLTPRETQRVIDLYRQVFEELNVI